jgi:hypothetical protein
MKPYLDTERQIGVAGEALRKQVIEEVRKIR